MQVLEVRDLLVLDSAVLVAVQLLLVAIVVERKGAIGIVGVL